MKRLKLQSPFLMGFGSILNISGKSNRLKRIIEVSDAEAIKSDWNTIGNDIKASLTSLRRKKQTENV